MYWRKQKCLSSSAVFLRRIYYDSTTHIECAGMTRGQFLMARGVRQGCPLSGFLFAMAFDAIFRWLQDAIIPRNPAGLDFPQPTQCAYDVDLAVVALSFRDFMAALAPAFHSVDHTVGLNLNHRKCFWVQYGSERRESLLNWLSGDCEEFREMQIVRFAKYVDHDWTGLPHSPLDGTPKKSSSVH